MILKEQQEKKVYSDGEAIEKRILEIAKKYPEDLSQDYISDCSEYTINNTFSSVRQNILNWYPFKEHASILEVGAGMGAITGMLCDRADYVTAIEMSAVRADVIKARYSGRKNLNVISENINDWNTEEKFDYVIFIGVLEYAAVFSESTKPYDEFMLSAKRLLKEDGRILFAIENRFGLKYWLGASEDHLQKPFAGIEGYKKAGTAKTFSKKELENILERVGFTNHRFYSVIPDYKFPELIFTDEYTPDYMNLKKVSFTYSKNSSLVADEKELYKDIIENGVFPFFANSFLVEASGERLDGRHIIHVSAKGEVYKDFRVNTVVDSENRVYKIPMHKNAKTHIDNICDNTKFLMERGVQVLSVYREKESIYSEKYNGVSAQGLFREALENNQIEAIRELIDALKTSFLKSSNAVEYNINNILVKNRLHDEGIDYGIILQKAFIDMTFYNAFWEDGQLIFFDQEWCFERVPLNFCLYYAVKSAYSRVDVQTNITFDELLEYMDIDKKEIAAYDKLEEYLWSNVLYRQTDFYGEDGNCNRYADYLTLSKQKNTMEQVKGDLENRCIDLENKNLDLENKNLDLENKNLDLENKNLDLENRNLDLKNRNFDLEAINLDLETKNLDLVSRKSEIGNRNKELEAQNLNLANENADLKQIVLNKEGHIELLLEVERIYEHEKQTHAYKFAKKLQRFANALLPLNSRRRFFARIVFNIFRHPRLMLHVINPKRIKNYLKYMKLEGMEGVKKRYEEALNVERMQMNPGSRINLSLEGTKNIENGAERKIEDYEKMTFPVYSKITVSIIIPVFNEFDYTYNCLKSILKCSGDVAYEVIIANDCSTDITNEIGKIVENVRLITTKENVRFLMNCNYAAQYAKGKFILFLNNDTQVQENWLKPLVDLIERDGSIGLVGSKLVYPDGYLQEAGGIVWQDASAWNYGNRKSPEEPEFNYVKEVDYISGAAIMIRKELWEEIGGFDERFVPAYCEDSDLAFEVRKHGYKVMYQPLSVVVHFEGVSNGIDINSGVKSYQVVNQEKFKEKWRDELATHFSNGEKVFVARDRSYNKKVLLMVDHYVPQYDKDAGSRTVFQYLCMFVNKGYHVKFIGDNFYRHEPYTTTLQQMGIEVLYGSYYANNWKEWIMQNAEYIEYVFLNRPHISVNYIDCIRDNTKARIIYYGHDLHFLREMRKYELTKEIKALRDSEDWKKKELTLMKKADIVYYPSKVEVAEIEKIDTTIRVKAITAYIFEDFVAEQYEFEKRKDIMFVGGFTHTPNVDAVVWFAKEILQDVIKQLPDIKFYVLGSNPPLEVQGLENENIIVKGFVSDEELLRFYRECRISVVPLRYGAGIKGKVIEAMRYGMPVITTTIGAEGIEGAENILCIENNEQTLAEHLVNLYQDKESLELMSKQSFEYIANNFSEEEAWDIIKCDFN